MESETQYDLKQPFNYSWKGDTTEADHIILHEPTAVHIAEVGKLRKWINNALQQNREELEEAQSQALEDADEKARADEPTEEEDDDDPFVDPSAIISLLARADIHLDDFYVIASKILMASGTAHIDGQQKMKPEHWKKVSSFDMENMIGHYISAFFLR